MIQYGFAFALDRPAVAWEIPLGHEERGAPITSLNHLRWIRRSADRPSVLFRGLDAPNASVDDDGTLESTALVRRSRYRIAVEPRFAGPLAPWRFGWHTDPLLVATGCSVSNAHGLLTFSNATRAGSRRGTVPASA